MTFAITLAVITKLTNIACIPTGNALIPRAAPATITVVSEVSAVVMCDTTSTAVAVVGRNALHGAVII